LSFNSKYGCAGRGYGVEEEFVLDEGSRSKTSLFLSAGDRRIHH